MKITNLRKGALAVFVFAIISAIVLLVVFGCSINPEMKENVVIQFVESDISAYSITPSIDMEIIEYVVTGDGRQNLGPYIIVKPDNLLTLTVKKGDYNLYVSGQNSIGDEVGYGIDTFSVQPGQVTVVSVTVSPVIGQGTFEANITYSPLEIIANPMMDVKIKSVSAGGFTDISGDFIYDSDVSSGWWNYSGLYEAGWNLLILKIMDGLTPVHGIVDSVRIVQGEITTLTLNLSENDFNLVGEIDGGIIEEMDNPIDIVLSGVQDNLALGSTMNIQSIPSEIVDSFLWFVNGDEQGEITDTLVFNGDEEGIFVISSVVQKANILSSKSHQVNVSVDLPDASPPVFSQIEGTYLESVDVTLSSAEGLSMRFTLDGTDPSDTVGTIYTGTITITADTTVKSIAYGGGYDNSIIAIADYVIDFEITKAEFDPGFYDGLLYTVNTRYGNDIGVKIDGESFFTSELKIVEYLNLDTMSVNDLDDIIYFVNIQHIQANYNNISDIAVLLNLVQTNSEVLTRDAVAESNTYGRYIALVFNPLSAQAKADLETIKILRLGLQVAYDL